ncbi:hypothetical protein HPB50_028942 [Hyalomma asiaticum]|nr:hypothetical protein HPB50_028942 [Hyalomma asiaticum]
MPVTRNGSSSTAPTSEEDGERRSTDGGEGSASRGAPDSASTGDAATSSGRANATLGPAFDLSAILQATVQAAVREAINGIAHLQSQQAAAMPVIGAGETSRLVPLFDPTSSDSPTVDAWIRRVDDLAEVYRWTDRVTSCNALARLDGPAKMWYDSLQSVNKTWPEWKAELKRAFPTTAGMQRLHREMEDRIHRRGEPIEAYYYDKLAKARRCNLSAEACIEYLITGLNDPDSIRAISTRTYDSPEELLQCLKRLEERVGTVGSRNSNLSKASEIQNFACHGNRAKRAAETSLNSSRENSPSEPRRKTLSNEREGPRCFNCNNYGHLSLNCPSPQRRARCSTCKRMGHEAQNCREKEDGPRLFQSVVSIDTRAADAANEKYFLLAKVNGHDIKAYVDLGSQCVTIRREDADRIGIIFTATDKRLTIGGYGSGRVTPCGEATINVTVDQATADVRVLIVPNESQAIPLIIGQPFTEQPHVTIVRRRNTLRIFDEQINEDESDDTLQSIEIADLPKRPVCLWARESTVVPPNYVGLVKLYVTGGEPSADVFVDTHHRCQEGREHCIPRCVVSVNEANETCIPVMNMPHHELNIKANERLARAEVCSCLDEQPVWDEQPSCSDTQPRPAGNLSFTTGPSVTPEHREKLGRLIQEYRDCSTDSISGTGRTKTVQMKIEVTTGEPARFLPYRLSFADIEPTACGKSRKLKERHKGPYAITEKLPNDRYRIGMLLSARRGRSHNDSSDSDRGGRELQDGRVCAPAHSLSERTARGSAKGGTSDQWAAVT